MSRLQQLLISFLFLLLLASLVCCSPSAKARTFENETVTFTIPAGWQTKQEVWDRPMEQTEYYGLGVQEIVMIQYPSEPGKGAIFFAVSSSPLLEGQNLEERFIRAYQLAVPEIEAASEKTFELGGLSGYEISYKRPWGEPWWQFRDIWLEKDAVIYVLSFHASPYSFETYSDVFNQILGSFQFKD